MITLTGTQVRGTMDRFEMDYTYATQPDGSCLAVDVADLGEGRAFAQHLGIGDEPMGTSPFGDMVCCSWEAVRVLD